MHFWPRFYIVVLATTLFFLIQFIFSNFHLDFYFLFLFGLLFPVFLWTFISPFSLNFYLPFLFGFLSPFYFHFTLDFYFPFSLWAFFNRGHILDFFLFCKDLLTTEKANGTTSFNLDKVMYYLKVSKPRKKYMLS